MAAGTPGHGAAPRGRLVEPDATGRPHVYTQITDVLEGRVAALEAVPEGTPGRPLRLALIVPHFAFGSGGHQVVFALAHELERRGHTVTTWVHDPHDERPDATGAVLRGTIREQYVELDGPVHAGFEHWDGADVVLATGWQTVYPAMTLPRCRARAYLVNDHEPEFYPTSLEAHFAARTYTLGLPCFVGGGPWLADLLTARYGAEIAGRFDYPVDPAFRPRPVPRRDDTIVVYARDSTPRRAVALALIALQELKARRPGLRIVLFGDQGVPRCTFAYEHLGPIAPADLSWVYSEATVGVAFSLTHGSLVPHDMLACGLPVVDLEGFGTAAEHAATGLVELAEPEPSAIATAVERLLDDPRERTRRAEAGQAYVAAAGWDRAADAVEAGLRSILRARVAAG